jgi:hypothetical protein
VLANPKFPIAMMQANLKFVMGRPMLTVDTLHKVGKPCVKLHNYYINNYKSGQDITVSYKDRHFLVGDDIFLISWSNLYEEKLMHCIGYLSNALLRIVSPQKLASLIYIFNIRVIYV